MNFGKRISAPRWTLGLGSVLLTLLLGGFALNDHLTSDTVWQLHMQTQGELQASALRSAQQDLLQRAELIGETLAHNRPVRELMLQLDDLLRDDPAALDSAAGTALRERLLAELTPVWRDLQRHRATQLQLYWGPAGIAVARMQDPLSWAMRWRPSVRCWTRRWATAKSLLQSISAATVPAIAPWCRCAAATIRPAS